MRAKTALTILVCLLPLLLCSCATSHLLRWSKGRSSVYSRPAELEEFVVPGGTVLAFPVTVAWDLATFPFQLVWGIHPYGASLDPLEIEEGRRR